MDRVKKPEPAYGEMAEAIQRYIIEATTHFSYVLSAADAEALHRAYENGHIAELFERDGRFGHICYNEVPHPVRSVDGSERPGSRPAAIREFFKKGLHERFLR